MENAPQNTKTILFVDDEIKILHGIKRMLRSKRRDWDIQLANSGQEALQIMARTKIDVIVSDMQMPNMDGAQLLKIVQARYPQTIRFVLSGYSGKEMIMRTIGPTDQFLNKPCDPDELIEVISKALCANEMVEVKDVKKMVSRLDRLPALPTIYVELQKSLESDTSSFDDIARIISKDIGILAKVLQLVNSSFFGLKNKIDNVKHAVTYLGIETLKAIVLAADVFSKFSSEEMKTYNINTLYNHSILVGMSAKKVGAVVNPDHNFIDSVGMAGILHDIGKIIFIKCFSEEYLEIQKKLHNSDKLITELEEELIGATHAAIGGYLMSLWGLPEEIINAITYHHDPLKSKNKNFTPLAAVYIANIIVNEQTHPREQLDMTYLETLKVSQFVPQWRETVLSMQTQQKD